MMALSKRFFLLSCLALRMAFAHGQNAAQASIRQYRDSLNELARIMQRGENDSARMASASVYHSILNYILNDSSSFTAHFDSIPNLSVRTSPDKLFRIYSWMTANYDGSHYTYFGYVQVRKGRTTTLFPLSDSTDVIDKPLSRKLKADNWFGAIYYSIIASPKKGKKYYTLLGWKGKNEMLTQKVIDVISFQGGKPVFGLPVFKVGNIYHSRVIFEYTSQAVMSLKAVGGNKLLVFDHIGRSGITGLTGPDGTYDAFKQVKGRWEYSEDVDVDAGFVPKKNSVKLFKDGELGK